MEGAQQHAEEQRLAIERQLQERLRGHSSYLATLDAHQHDHQSSHASSSPNTLDDGAAPGSSSVAPRSAQDDTGRAPDPLQAPDPRTVGTAAQPITLDGQMAQEQELEVDVRPVQSSKEASAGAPDNSV